MGSVSVLLGCGLVPSPVPEADVLLAELALVTECDQARDDQLVDDTPSRRLGGPRQAGTGKDASVQRCGGVYRS